MGELRGETTTLGSAGSGQTTGDRCVEKIPVVRPIDGESTSSRIDMKPKGII